MENESADPAFDGFPEATKGLFHMNAVPVGAPIPVTDIVGMDPGEMKAKPSATSDGMAVSKEEFFGWRKPGQSKASVSEYA